MSSGELLVIIGPPAVGKMTVGRAVSAASDFRLFHNHHTIEPLAEHGVRLVFTFVWPVDEEGDAATVREYVAPYVDRGLPVRPDRGQAVQGRPDEVAGRILDWLDPGSRPRVERGDK